ncbi:MAG: ral secretion pathway protein [Patescibacteria group bacterium]|nr:ral secretion pathway protein [Patescibacteria group bacterium]
MYRPKGCEHCGFTGVRGRVGIYEVLHFSNSVRDLVRQGESPSRILEEGRKNDLILMREDGVLKAMRGKTTLEEIFAAIG